MDRLPRRARQVCLLVVNHQLQIQTTIRYHRTGGSVARTPHEPCAPNEPARADEAELAHGDLPIARAARAARIADEPFVTVGVDVEVTSPLTGERAPRAKVAPRAARAARADEPARPHLQTPMTIAREARVARIAAEPFDRRC